jgi:hypothetical protein
MRPTTQPLPTEDPHRNHGLFSDHYLNVTLPGRPEWSELIDEARPVMEAVARVFDSPEIHEAMIESMISLEKALKPPINELRL